MCAYLRLTIVCRLVQRLLGSVLSALQLSCAVVCVYTDWATYCQPGLYF